MTRSVKFYTYELLCALYTYSAIIEHKYNADDPYMAHGRLWHGDYLGTKEYNT